jgi:hypothetical protein
MHNTVSKKYAKKLREIQRLKQKPNPTEEENVKLAKENQFKKELRTRSTTPLLNRIPDDVQQIILSFLPTNIRLNILRKKYNIRDIEVALYDAPDSVSLLKIYHRYGMICRDILEQSLPKNGDILSKISRFFYYLDHIDWFMSRKWFHSISCCYEFKKIVIYTIEYYVKMYKLKDKTEWIQQREKDILDLYHFVLNHVSFLKDAKLQSHTNTKEKYRVA